MIRIVVSSITCIMVLMIVLEPHCLNAEIDRNLHRQSESNYAFTMIFLFIFFIEDARETLSTSAEFYLRWDCV